MPIQQDPGRPVKTYDATGKLLSTATNDAAPIKTQDVNGRAIPTEKSALKATQEIQKGIKSEANLVAEKAASSLNFSDTKASDNLAPPEDKPDQTETKDPEKITEAKIRKEYLEAQRINRQAKENQKNTKYNLEKSEIFEKARILAENGEDPTALIKAFNLDPVKFYRAMTTYALSDKGKQEEVDPVKKEMAEHKARLDKYAKDLEEQSKKIQEKEDLAAHNQVIQEKVIPLLKDNQEKYEVLLTHYGNQAAVEVYKNVWEIYQQTGKTRSFTEVADEMEKYWSEQIESGINLAYNMKRFKNRFTQSDLETSGNKNTERPDKTNSSVTLSNQQQISTTSSNTNPYRGMTRDERVAAILKKFDK